MQLMKALLASCVVIVPVTVLAQPTAPMPAQPIGPTPALPPPPPGAPVTAFQPAEPAAAPAPPAPGLTNTMVDETGERTYATVGVVEVGASAGLAIAQDIRAVSFSPSIGYFISDNLELSGILGVTNLKAGSESATAWSALAEPSFHFPLSPAVFGFVGMGVGVSYVSQLGSALAVSPQAGLDVRIGQSGILRPSLSYEYTTHDATGTIDKNGKTNVTLVGISSTLLFNIGYSKMW